jgi:glycosyltransferase involved in cell wall biosynthesis
MPKVSVILPVYNCEQYIYETVLSVLKQTFTDFELLIVDDCSTDKSVSIIREFNDSRINLIIKQKNTGYTDSLNYAVSIAKGKYIARMDGDDICLPTRFEKQVAFLEKNTDVILCGTAIQFIGFYNGIKQYPLKHEDIKIKLCFVTPFCHPSVMGKKEVFLQFPYDKNFEPAEDIHLWSRIVKMGKLENLDEILLNYRTHEMQVSVSKKEIQNQKALSIRKEYLKNFFWEQKFSEEDFKLIFANNKINTQDECKTVVFFLNFLKNQNYKIKEFDVEKFDKALEHVKILKLKSFFNFKRFFKFTSVMFFIRYVNFKEAIQILSLRKRIMNILK